jgi:hypothetical protein
MNQIQVMKWAERVAKREAPESTFEWVQKPKHVTYPTGVRGWIGRVRQSAPGYRARERIVDADESGILVR